MHGVRPAQMGTRARRGEDAGANLPRSCSQLARAPCINTRLLCLHPPL